MAAQDLTLLRNIGIIAHIDAGKTTTTERILFYTGITHKIGEVHDGGATMDWMAQEQERGITITSAATHCKWKTLAGDKAVDVNIIDTPGHVDFTVEVERSLRVLDGAVTILDSKMGVEPQSETVWRQADRYGVPRMIFANKINAFGANFKMCIDSCQKRLSPNCLALFLPIGESEEHRGVVDLLENCAWVYANDEHTEIEKAEIPADMASEAQIRRTALIEKIVEQDEAVLEKYLEGAEPDLATLRTLLRKAVIAMEVFPMMVGDGRTAIVKKVLDSVAYYLPSPLDRNNGVIEGFKADSEEKVTRKASDSEPLTAMAFKVATDPFVGRLTFVRVYSGKLTAGSYVVNAENGKKERIARLVLMHSKDREEVSEIGAGGIGAVIGLKDTKTGDTLCDEKNLMVLEKMTFMEPVISLAIEPKSKGDQEKMGIALGKLTEEDPTLHAKTDPETNQTVISGVGELHLDIIVDRMKREFGVEVNVGAPQVAYRETITKNQDFDHKFVRQSGGSGQYGHVVGTVEPIDPTQEGAKEFEFVNEIKGGVIPNEYIPACEKGFKEAVSAGPVAGYPMVDVKVRLTYGSYHDVDSSEVAFKTAASQALKEAALKAGACLLEPIMDVEIVVPEEFMGDVMGDINSRRGMIESTEDIGVAKVIKAKVPLSSMFGYVTALRSMTQGRAGNPSMVFSHYAKAPGNVEAEVKKARGMA